MRLGRNLLRPSIRTLILILVLLAVFESIIAVEASQVTAAKNINLVVNVHNIKGLNLPNAGGRITVYLYDSNWNQIDMKTTSFTGGEGHVGVTFTGLKTGTYWIEVFQAPNTGFGSTEYWGFAWIDLSSGGIKTVNFYRNTPYITGIQLSSNRVSTGSTLTVNVKVKYPYYAKDQSNKVYYSIKLIADRDKHPYWDIEKSSVEYPINNGEERQVTFTLSPNRPGTYYVYGLVYFHYPWWHNRKELSDQYPWLVKFAVPPKVPVSQKNQAQYNFALTMGSKSIPLGDSIVISGKICPRPNPDPNTGVGTKIYYLAPNGKTIERYSAHNPYCEGFTVDYFKPATPGIWRVYSVATWTENGVEHSIRSTTVSFNVIAPSPKSTRLILAVRPSTVKAGEKVELWSRLFDTNGNVLLGKTLKFYVDGGYVGSDSNTETGWANIEYTANKPGRHEVKVIFEGDSEYASSYTTGTLTVTSPPPMPYSHIVGNYYVAFIDGYPGNISISKMGSPPDWKLHSIVDVTPREFRGTIGNFDVRWDGKKIVFCSNRGGNWNIYLGDLSFSADKISIENVVSIASSQSNEEDPKFSWDGERVVYKNNTNQIWLYDLASRKSEKIIGGKCEKWAPTFDSTGTKIAYTNGSHERAEIYIYNLITKSNERITSNDHMDWYPTFLPNGDLVYINHTSTTDDDL